MSIRIRDLELGTVHEHTGDGRDLALAAWEILARREREHEDIDYDTLNMIVQEDALGYVTGGEGI